MNPFHIGDTVTLKDPENAATRFHGNHVIKDINKDSIRIEQIWWHFTHFSLVKAGLLSRVGQVTSAIPESHPCAQDIEPGPWGIIGSTKEQDPKGLPAAAPGAKLDKGKVEAGLLLDFGLALTEVAKVSTFGARKYSRGGWLHTDDGERRYQDAGMRHQFAANREDIDPDSGLLHLACQAWNVLAELELRLRRQQKEQ